MWASLKRAPTNPTKHRTVVNRPILMSKNPPALNANASCLICSTNSCCKSLNAGAECNPPKHPTNRAVRKDCELYLIEKRRDVRTLYVQYTCCVHRSQLTHSSTNTISVGTTPYSDSVIAPSGTAPVNRADDIK